MTILLVLFLCLISLLSRRGEFSTVGGINSWENVAKDGTKVAIYDHLFTQEHLQNINDFLKEVSWEFRTDKTSTLCPECTRTFQSSLPVASFSSSSTWRKIKSIFNQNGSSNMDAVYPQNVHGNLLISGQQSLDQQCADTQEHVIILFLNKNWKKNNYGEVLVFDKQGEIVKAVHPKYGRVVVLSCPVEYLTHAPATSSYHRFYFLKIETTSSRSVFEQQSSEQHLMISMIQLADIKRFSHFDASKNLVSTSSVLDNKSLDVAKFITHNYTALEGKHILVLDDVLSKQDVDKLFEWMYHGMYHDMPAGDYSTDNVQWVLGIETIPFLQTHLWTIVKQIVQYVSGQSSFYPYDISCNHIQSFDQTKIHTDCNNLENEYTFMIYLNPNWTNNHYGETVFFDGDDEIVAAISPRHGRIVIFHGTIPHSARPPSPLFQGARYTFVVKLSSSKELAFNKFFKAEIEEDSEPEEEMNEEDKESLMTKREKLKIKFFEAEEAEINEFDSNNSNLMDELIAMEEKLLELLEQL